MDIPVELSRIVITELGEQQVIFLKEIEGDRTFPIIIGISEALAVDRRLKGIETPRPMTHDLLAGVVESLGGTIERVVVNDLQDHTFYASLFIRRDGELIEVDARPSDAIALAAGLNTPLFVADHVFEQVSQAEPGTREERIELLRRRKESLADQIEAMHDMLEDPEFIEETPEPILNHTRQQLDQMKTEYEAIEDILRRLG
jgi:uncharacterized protein